MRYCVTGGAGFIGSHVVDLLLARGDTVTVVDNLRTGRRRNLDVGVQFYEGTILDPEVLIPAVDGCDWVIHMAANAEGRRGFARPGWDIEQNIVGTSTVLETMRALGVTNIFYASSGSVYGNTKMGSIPEDCPFPTQTSLYGASKIAGEGLIGAYVEAAGFNGVIGRWMQAIGERYVHGHVIDFVRQLQRNPDRLTVLGSGNQAKSGIYVKDLAAGILHSCQRYNDGIQVFNMGGTAMVSIRESAQIIAETMGCDPEIIYQGETWPGDNPNTYLDSTKLRKLGWDTKVSVREAIARTVRYLLTVDYL